MSEDMNGSLLIQFVNVTVIDGDEDGTGSVRFCKNCGGPVRRNNAFGICTKNPECKRARKRERYASDPDYGELERERSRAQYASRPEYRERKRLRKLERYANDPEYRERELARFRERDTSDPEFRDRRIARQRERRAAKRAVNSTTSHCQLAQETPGVFEKPGN